MFRGLVFVGLLAMAPSLAIAQQPCTTDSRRVVDELYRHMLERSADAGSQGWVDRLNSGTTVREIVRQIAQSPEHMQRFFNPSEGATANENAVSTSICSTCQVARSSAGRTCVWRRLRASGSRRAPP